MHEEMFRADGVAHVVECLPTKYKARSSNTSTVIKEKEKRKMLSILSHQGNANQLYIEILPHSRQNGSH
jgi:hypothetical protein